MYQASPVLGRSAIIIGATGLVGNILLQHLTRMYSQVIVIARTPPKLPDPPAGGQTGVTFCFLDNFQHLAEYMQHLPVPVGPHTDAFTCLGTTRSVAGSAQAFRAVDYGYNITFARCCHALGIRQFFLLSAAGARLGSMLFYQRTKGQLEWDIIQLKFERLAIFRPGLLLGEHAGRPVEYWAQRAFGYINRILPATSGLRAIEAERVAETISRQAHRWGVDKPLPDEPGTAVQVKILDNTDLLRITLLAAQGAS